MSDRGIIKWRPFNSVSNGENIIDDLEYKRKMIKKPELSNDQIELLNEKLLDCFHSKNNTTFKYYKAGYINEVTGIVNKIDSIKKIIMMDHDFILYIDQIVDIIN